MLCRERVGVPAASLLQVTAAHLREGHQRICLPAGGPLPAPESPSPALGPGRRAGGIPVLPGGWHAGVTAPYLAD